ncbi:MAG: tetratricopeptide repeat protein [Deltaproteobacteria bacterium]|nr:tetratricopeptide repeat protein [Deltaproteobacteria bacterium]
MKKTIVFSIICLCLAATAATGQDAMEFYNRGLKSSLSYKKVEYFTKALQIDPNLVEAYENRAIHYYFQEHFDRAIEDYSRVIELKPYDADAHRMRGMAYLKKAHGEGMMAEINRLVHRHRQPGVPEDRNSLVKAIDNFSRAIKMDPQMATAYSYRAAAYRLNGNIDEAVLDVTRALELQGDQKSTAHAYDVLALIYRQLGQNELYEAAYSKVVELDPYSTDYPPLHVPLISTSYTPNTESLKVVRLFGLIGIIVISFILIFKLGLRAPKKKD